MKLATKTVELIDVRDWDNLVSTIYGKPYSFQQQDGCKPRGVYDIDVPAENWGYENDTVLEKCNGPEEGVSLKAWLERDPNQPLQSDEGDHALNLWWLRNFYPHVNEVINDLYNKGVLDLEEGEYGIDVDW